MANITFEEFEGVSKKKKKENSSVKTTSKPSASSKTAITFDEFDSIASKDKDNRIASAKAKILQNDLINRANVGKGADYKKLPGSNSLRDLTSGGLRRRAAEIADYAKENPNSGINADAFEEAVKAVTGDKVKDTMIKRVAKKQAKDEAIKKATQPSVSAEEFTAGLSNGMAKLKKLEEQYANAFKPYQVMMDNRSQPDSAIYKQNEALYRKHLGDFKSLDDLGNTIQNTQRDIERYEADQKKYEYNLKLAENYNAIQSLSNFGTYATVGSQTLPKYNSLTDVRNMSDADVAALYINSDDTERTNISRMYEYPGLLSNYDYLTNEQKNTYNAIRAKDGEAAGYEYLEYIEPMLVRQSYYQQEMELREKSTKNALNAIFQSAGTALTSPLRGLDYVAHTTNAIFGGGEDALGYAGDYAMTPAKASTIVRSAVTNDMNTKVGQFFYNTGMSMADNIVTIAASGGNEGVSLALMGAGAASQSYYEAKEKGLTNNEALAVGFLSGALEALTEKIGLDNLFKIIGSSGKNTFVNILLEALKQTGAEGGEEFLASIGGATIDYAVAGDLSDYNLSIQNYMEQGNTPEEARKMAAKDFWGQVLEDTLSGAVSGFAMGGGGAAITSAVATNQYRKAEGQTILDTVGYDKLKKLSEEVAKNSVKQTETSAQKTVKRIESKGGDYLESNPQEAYKLYKQINKEAVKQNKKFDDIVSAIKSDTNLTDGSAKKIAKKITSDIVNGREYSEVTYSKYLDGYVFTGENESGESASKTKILETIKGQFEQKKAEYDKRVESYNAVLGVEPAKPTPAAVEEVKVAMEALPERTISTDGKTLDTDGNVVEIADFDSVKTVDGKTEITYKLDNGETISNTDIQYASEADALIYESVAGMTGDFSAAKQLVDAFKLTPGKSAAIYARAITEAYRYGQYNMSLDGASFASDITEAQRNKAYDLGKKFAENQIARSEGKIKADIRKAPKGEKRVGSVKFDSTGKKLNDQQSSGVKMMEHLSKFLGTDFYVFESYEKDGKRVYKDANGVEHSAPNGWFDPSNNTFHIDLNAGNKGEGLVLFTVSHELTHFIKKWSPAKFKVLADFLVERYGTGRVEDLVKKQMEKAKRNGRTLTYDEAFEEMVADSMETMLSSENVVQDLVELKKRDKKLWDKIKEFFANIIEDLKAIVNAYKGVAPTSVEGRIIASMTDSINQLEKLFADALYAASENYQKTGAAKDTQTSNTEIKFDLREIANNGRFVFEGKYPLGIPAKEKGNYIVTLIQNAWSKNPIKLTIWDADGTKRTIIAAFDPTVKERSDATKIAYGNRHGTASEKRITLDLADDLYFIAETASFSKSKIATDKSENPAHDGVVMYHYFVNDIYYIPKGENKKIPVRMNIDIKERRDGMFFYSFHVDVNEERLLLSENNKRTARQTLHAAVAELMSDNDSLNKSMPQPNNGVKTSLRDSEGRTLTEQQQEFFKDSKVRDENGNLLVMYHGTPNAGFTQFKPGTYFSEHKWYAENYKGQGASSLGYKKSANNPDVYAVYLNIKKPFDTRNKAERDIFYNEYYGKWGMGTDLMESGLPDWMDGTDLQEFLEENGYDYDGLILDEGGVGGYGDEVKSRGLSYVVFDSAQVKNVDNATPTASPDIRHSDRDPDAERVAEVLQKENTKLKEDVQYLKELLKLQKSVTHGKLLTRSSVEAAAGHLMNTTKARGEKAELVKLLNSFYEYIAAGEFLTWDGVVENAQPAIEWLQNHIVEKKQIDEYSAGILREIRNSRFRLDDLQKKEVAYYYGSYNNFRKQSMGSFIIAENGSAFDTRWQELSEMYPDIFDPETSSNDMPSELMNIVDRLRNTDMGMEYAYDQEMMSQDLLQQVYDSYWNVSTLRTVADVKQKEINKLKATHAKRMTELREYHKEQTAKLKKDYSEKLKRARQEYREKSEAKQREIITRYQESRKRGIESRKMTELRGKIKSVVNELNQLLLKGSKDKHVMIGLQKAVAEALDAVNMDTVGAEQRIAKLQEDLLKAKTPEKIQEISRKIDHIQQMGDRMDSRLSSLKAAYAEIKNSDDPLVANAYDEVISQRIDSVSEIVGNTPLRDMSLNQLGEVYDMYKMVLTVVRNSNKAFKAAKSESISTLANRTMEEIRKVGGEKQYSIKALAGAKKFAWNNLKPIYALRTIGSDTLTEAFENVRAGEDTWAVDVNEAKNFSDRISKKYGYKNWDFKKRYSFKSTTGVDFELSLEQILSLYAYSKREQADRHLERGGFVFDNAIETRKVTTNNGEKKSSVFKYTINTATTHKVSKDVVAKIVDTLTDEQKMFVDLMQGYLSDVMGAKGNEVSLEMYGVKLFNEQNYFPLKSAKQFMFEQNETAGEVRIKNSSFSKETVVNASNPIILSNFMDVWANHVNDMAMYHAFVLPLEDFNRIFNYKTPTTQNMNTESVKMYMQNAYGTQSVQYIKELITDLNGGVRSDPRESTGKKLISRFKKSAVMASASVVVQQPSAVARALAIIDAKYFDFSPKLIKHNELWNEVKKYAPVAVIKEMGRFDTDMGRSTVDYIKGDATFMEKIDEVLSKPAEYADELTWCHIWTAVKRETLAKHKDIKYGSDEFLKVAGKRFTEVVTRTQVYDSVLARSANMRSKSVFMNMVTSFMAEPTTSMNMMTDAILQGKRGNKSYARKTVFAVYSSIILNAALSSIIYAMRDDDEDETFLEKYVGSFTTEIIDGVNPLTYLPYIKDAWSLAQGYDVERSDMSLISDLVDAFQNIVKVAGTDTEEMDDDELDAYYKKRSQAIWGAVDAIASVIGIPEKNLRRDIKAGFNTYKTSTYGLENNTKSMWEQIVDSVKNSTPVWGWMKDEAKEDKLYEAIISDDEAYRKRIESQYKDQDAIDNAIRKTLRKNDPRIKQAAQAYYDGDIAEYTRLANAIIANGFSQDNVVKAIKSEVEVLKPDEETVSKVTGFYGADAFIPAVIGGDNDTANLVKQDLINTMVANGKTEEEAENSFASTVKSNCKKLIITEGIDKADAIDILTTYCDEETADAKKIVSEWQFEADYGFSWDNRYDSYKNGEITAADLKKQLMDVEGYTANEARNKIAQLDYQKAHPDTYVDDAWVAEYYNAIQTSGMSIDTFISYRSKVKGITGKDKKQRRLEVIDSMPISDAQKDALYFAEGWAESKLHEAPWH